MSTLGDAWGREPEPTGGPLTLDYFRTKALEFQVALNAIDTAYRAANDALASGALDETSQAEIFAALDEYESKRLTLKLTAEAINAGAAVVNATGGRFPQLSIPGTLGALPIAPLAMVAAIATAAALITWGSQWVAGVNDRLKRAQLIAGASQTQRDALIRSISDSDNAVNQTQSSALATIAPAIKWVAIGVVAFLAYRAYTRRK